MGIGHRVKSVSEKLPILWTSNFRESREHFHIPCELEIGTLTSIGAFWTNLKIDFLLSDKQSRQESRNIERVCSTKLSSNSIAGLCSAGREDNYVKGKKSLLNTSAYWNNSVKIVEINKCLTRVNFPRYCNYLTVILQKPNLILNVDGFIGVSMVDLLRNCGLFTT